MNIVLDLDGVVYNIAAHKAQVLLATNHGIQRPPLHMLSSFFIDNNAGTFYRHIKGIGYTPEYSVANSEADYQAGKTIYRELQLAVYNDPIHSIARGEAIPGSHSGIQQLTAAGHQVSIITARDAQSFPPMQVWLADQGLTHIPIQAVGHKQPKTQALLAAGAQIYVEDEPKYARVLAKEFADIRQQNPNIVIPQIVLLDEYDKAPQIPDVLNFNNWQAVTDYVSSLPVTPY